MRRGKNTILILPVVFLVAVVFLYTVPAGAGPYLDSAHGDSAYGVKRSAAGFPVDYPRGLCAHCHEQHASIGGSEPTPTGGPDNYMLFDTNYTGQTADFCFDCHTDTSSYQAGGSIVNRSYSFRAGGWTSDTLNDILEAFSFNYAPSGNSHHLDDISTFISGRWSYTSDSNPCVACHNPHSAQGDPINAPNSAKSSSSRGWPVSRPSLHSKDNNAWGLWGDGTGEKMSDYVGGLLYQAPYRYNSTTTFEPDGSTTENGSNLTDFVSFCTDCHNTTNTIYSTTLGGNLGTIDWVTAGGDASTSGDKHGKNGATVGIDIDPPFLPINYGQYVLSCTDCHEPHGSPNDYLIRREVNGSVLAGTVGSGTKDFGYLCRQCHIDDNDYNNGTVNAWEYVHHISIPDHPYAQTSCSRCHGSGGNPPPPIRCSLCHYHGSSAANRRTF
ncbi:hypothetical protein MNBD_NITROSPIRAE03-1452 [hydrothermal vent metagenome]|uniref:Doubled CXXCH motif domain-containing protein n=1 Tax=hydrothermal vent metagenome TaxID=652676 RepID=A0A3B1CIE2_9ZZZZ